MIAEKLVPAVTAALGVSGAKAAATAFRQGARRGPLRHPLPVEARGELTPEETQRSFRVVLGDHVTMDTGTGLVHTAPGHGEDDFATGQREKLPILSPVDEAGRYTTVAKYRGKKVLDANPEIVEDLRAAGRARGPRPEVPARVSALLALQEPGDLPGHRAVVRPPRRSEDRRAPGGAGSDRPGEVDARLGRGPHRGHGREPPRMADLEAAPLGLADHAALRDAGRRARGRLSLERRAGRAEEVLRARRRHLPHGGRATPGTRAPPRTSCRQSADLRGFARSDFQPETDILDVWFDSGVSHLAVLRSGAWPELTRSDGRRPADLYVEGHDQHRGWFQSSLLTSVALFGDAPYEGVITHGFVVDGQGRKMSKSIGNVVAPQDLIQKYGADIVRLWVASLDYRDDDPDLRGDPRALRRGLSEDPQHDALPALQPLRLRSGLRHGRGPRAGAPRPLGPGRGARDRPADPRGLRRLPVPRHLPPARELLRHDPLGVLLRHPQGPSVRLGGLCARAPLSPDRPLPHCPRPGRRGRSGAPVHGRGDLEGASGKEGRIGPPRAFRQPGRRCPETPPPGPPGSD